MAGHFLGKTGVVLIVAGVIFWAQGVSAQPPAAPDSGGDAVVTPPAPMTDIHDVKPLASVFFPRSFAKSAWYLIAGLVLAGLVTIACRFWRNKKRPLDIAPSEVILPPEVAAHEALDKLAAEPEISEKAFYFRLSAILRIYLSGRFSIDGLEMTTEELLPAVERLGIDRALKSGIKDFLLFSDPVKFADLSAPASRRISDLEFVRGFVNRTPPDSSRDETTGADKPLTPVAAGNNTA